MRDRKTFGTACLLGVGVFIFYLATLAPTVLWGDDAFFQWSAATGYLQPDGGGHLLHFVLARLFVQLPIGDVGFRVNLLSAVAGTITILLIFGSGRSLQLSNSAALAGALSLTVAHTFWTHAVRAEVYTVFTMFLALILWLLVRWRVDRPFSLYLAAFLIGPTLLSHQMIILLLPAFGLLLWLRRSWLRANTRLLTLISFISGLTVAIAAIQLQVGGENLVDSLFIYFTQSGSDFSHSLFDFSLNQFLADIAFWLGLLGLQFVGPAVFLTLLGIWYWRKRPTVLLPLLTLYVTTVLFAISYRVNDRFVFFLPSYLVIALFVGRGWQMLWEKRPMLAKPTLPLLILFPILTYAALPPILQTAEFPLPNVRELPGREPISFFLWPAKNGYDGAAVFGRNTLSTLPQESILIADHTPFETLTYLQKIEGTRPDVLLIKVESRQNLEPIIETFEKNQPIYLADNNPAYYNLSSLPRAVLIPDGMIYRLDYE